MPSTRRCGARSSRASSRTRRWRGSSSTRLTSHGRRDSPARAGSRTRDGSPASGTPSGALAAHDPGDEGAARASRARRLRRRAALPRRSTTAAARCSPSSPARPRSSRSRSGRCTRRGARQRRGAPASLPRRGSVVRRDAARLATGRAGRRSAAGSSATTTRTSTTSSSPAAVPSRSSTSTWPVRAPRRGTWRAPPGCGCRCATSATCPSRLRGRTLDAVAPVRRRLRHAQRVTVRGSWTRWSTPTTGATASCVTAVAAGHESFGRMWHGGGAAGRSALAAGSRTTATRCEPRSTSHG